MLLAMAPREYRFVQVDVFTDRVFGGNPLAVVLDGRGLSDGEMQAIAGEMNLAETTFVLPATRPDCTARVRIFTPRRELPFAGHPTLGTAWVLASQGTLPVGTTTLALEEGIGAVPVTLEGDPRRPHLVWMSHRAAEFAPEVVARAAVAGALGLAEADLLPGAAVQSVSTGNWFLFVPLRDRRAVDAAMLDERALAATLAGQTALGVFVFAPDGERRVFARMFAPSSGIPEDPATGSASGPLGAYLVRHHLVKAAAEVAIVSEQGTRMGRQSFVHILLRCSPEGVVEDIQVGGGVVPVLEGVLRLPSPA
jgi:trans-2,3-dihydro-3-hydroxyanthranilate isomerase